MSITRRSARRAVCAAGVTAAVLAGAGHSAPPAAAAAAARTPECVGLVPTVTPDGRLRLYDVTEMSEDLRGVDDKLGYVPRDLSLVAQSGDPSNSRTVYVALTPGGGLRKVETHARWDDGPYRSRLAQRTLSTRWQHVAQVTGAVDGLDNDEGYLYALTKKGALVRYHHTTTKGVSKGTAVTGNTLSAWRNLTLVSSESVRGLGRADILAATHARTGALVEIAVSTKAKPAYKIATLRRTGRPATAMNALQCDNGRAGFLRLAGNTAKSVTVTLDRDPADMSGHDLSDLPGYRSRMVGHIY